MVGSALNFATSVLVSEPIAPSIVNVNANSMPAALWITFDREVTHLEPYPFSSLSIIWESNFYTVDDLDEQDETTRQLFTTMGAATGLPNQIGISDPTGFHTLGHPELPLLTSLWPIPYP